MTLETGSTVYVAFCTANAVGDVTTRVRRCEVLHGEGRLVRDEEGATFVPYEGVQAVLPTEADGWKYCADELAALAAKIDAEVAACRRKAGAAMVQA
jgi:hypothetical protein